MRLLFIALFFVQFIETFAQKTYDDKNLPFQVIYAENVLNKEGKEVTNLQLISVNDVLTIKQGGFLSMMHYFGYPIEFEGDTTVNIKALQTQFDLLRSGKKKNKYSYLSRPNIAHLVIDNSTQARKSKLSLARACHDCNFDMEIVQPPKYVTREILVSNELCLKWESSKSGKYAIEVKNMFDDSLKTFYSTTNELKIDSAEINALIEKDHTLLIQIKDIADKKIYSDQTVVRKYRLNPIDYPFSCTPQKATYALITGLYLELLPSDHINEAEAYFTMAAELSDKQFFKTMLDNFNKRRQ